MRKRSNPPAQKAEPVPPPIPPPPEISIGQTREQVVATLGEPQKIVKLSNKDIYIYKDLKVIFINNKVSDVQ